ENDEVTEETPQKDENKKPVEKDQVQEDNKTKEEVELPKEDTQKENEYQEEVQEPTEVVEPKENIPQAEEKPTNTPVEPEVEVEPPVQNKDVKTKVNDAYNNASNTQELKKQLTDVVNQTFYLRDNQAFMKSLKVNIEDLSPEEFTYMILKQACENRERNN